MLDKLPTLTHLLKSLQQVPYLSSKNLYKVADYFLSADERQLEIFCQTIIAAHKKLRPCPTCFSWTELGSSCMFCSSAKRNQAIICVVETWQELLVLEKIQGYEGVYHVLGGVICPLEGIGPEDLTINALIERVSKGGVAELILATNQTPEGQATSAYIARRLQSVPVVISCLARGLPVGSSLEAMDKVTIYKALSERRPY